MSKLFDMNDFMISGTPKYYKENEYGVNVGIEVAGMPGGKYLWIGLSKVGKEQKQPFTEQAFLAAKSVTIISLKLDSFKDKKTGSTRYSSKANGHTALLDVDLSINMGKIGGKVTLLNTNLSLVVIQVPYMGRSADKKPETKYREVMVKWPSGQTMPEQNDEVFILGSLKLSADGSLFVEAGKALVV